MTPNASTTYRIQFEPSDLGKVHLLASRTSRAETLLQYSPPMAHAQAIAALSYAEYIEFENTSEQKHEYLRGEIFAMAGGTLEHARLASRISWLLGNALAGKPCETFSSDAKVRVDATDLTTYPDVTVICGHIERSPIDAEAATNPVVLVEVLSQSTEAYDRGEKFSHYRQLDSLREYVLVAQDEPRLEVFRRTNSGTWELFEARSGGSVTLASVGVEISVDDVFESVLDAN